MIHLIISYTWGNEIWASNVSKCVVPPIRLKTTGISLSSFRLTSIQSRIIIIRFSWGYFKFSCQNELYVWWFTKFYCIFPSFIKCIKQVQSVNYLQTLYFYKIKSNYLLLRLLATGSLFFPIGLECSIGRNWNAFSQSYARKLLSPAHFLRQPVRVVQRAAPVPVDKKHIAWSERRKLLTI